MEDNLNNLQKVNALYGNETIEHTESEREQVRTRPAVYFGTNDVHGALNGLFEIITNGADEGSTLRKNGITNCVIKTTIEEDFDAIAKGDVNSSYICTVTDNGRGVPMAWNEKAKKFNWDLVYNRLFASGKRGNSAYSGAAGLNGLGATLCNFCSTFFTVISRRVEVDATGKQTKVEYEMNFEDGLPKGELIVRDWRTGTENITGLTGTGTYVRYKMDDRFFLDTRYSYEELADRLRKLATAVSGLKYELQFLDKQAVTFYFPNGTADFLKELIAEPITKEIFSVKAAEKVTDKFVGEEVHYTIDVDCAITFNNKSGFIETYHNGTFLPENGVAYLGAKDAIKDVLENFGQKNGQLKAKERILNSDLDDILCIISVSSMDHGEYSSYSGQDKRALNNQTVYNAFRIQVTTAFRDWLTTHKEDGLKVIQAIKLCKEAREKADQIKKKLVKQLSTNPNELRNRPAKLHDCSSRNTAENEIFIVEGDSAAGSALSARNAIIHAVYPLTGVILNCEKASPEQILNNRVIRELIQIFGCGIEIPAENKHMSKVLKDLPKFDVNKLNYGKVIFLTDADLDGWHISCLLLVFVAKLMPELLRQNKVYIAQAPLFKVIYSNNKTYNYCYTDEELKQTLDKAKSIGKKIKYIKRFKGLGEMQPEELAESVMNADTRKLMPIDFTDEKGFHNIMQDLLGNNLDERKAWIREYFDMVIEEEQMAEQEYLLSAANEM